MNQSSLKKVSRVPRATTTTAEAAQTTAIGRRESRGMLLIIPLTAQDPRKLTRYFALLSCKTLELTFALAVQDG
jgi:hypothetical protein